MMSAGDWPMIPRLVFLALSPTRMLGPEHVGKLLDEIHHEFPLAAAVPVVVARLPLPSSVICWGVSMWALV
ncbi:hypothetical protein DF032_05720 [Burkholderia seminalis]|nr:hypothetical protein DF032_05720 [Burkholderia seminalis]